MSEAALLQAIIDSPDDESLRLVYADYLEENGEAARADFIRTQCELARLPEDSERRASLEARERELLPGFTEKTLAERYQKFLEESSQDEEVLRLCRQHRALPILFDQGVGWRAIRMDGVTMAFLWGEGGVPKAPSVQVDLRVRNATLFEATAEVPDLWLFIPPRPVTARECLRCEGTGDDPQHIAWDVGGSRTIRYRCRYCGGLKWVPCSANDPLR